MKAATKSVPEETSLRVTCDGKGEIGMLVFDRDNRLLRGARTFPPALVLRLIIHFVKEERQFGMIQCKGNTYRYKASDFEASLIRAAM